MSAVWFVQVTAGSRTMNHAMKAVAKYYGLPVALFQRTVEQWGNRHKAQVCNDR
jgi:hypothetical protein